jgi:RNA polymerase sigma factor for flagellar operon FliA
MDPRERAALLQQNVGLVHHVVRKLAAHLSTAADLDDMVSAGALGLVQAVDSFDRRRGLSFSTYAVPRIRGAILDELRKQDHVPRNVRRRSREMTRARDALTGRLRRPPSLDEIAGHMRVPSGMLRRWELDAEGAVRCSLDQPATRREASATLGESMTDDRVPSVDDTLTLEAEAARLKGAIATLKAQERTVLALNYFEDLKLHEIAEVLGLSVCRISQIRTAALAKLRVVLSGLRAA